MDVSALPWMALVAVSALLSSLVSFIDNYSSDVLFDGKYSQAEKLISGPIYAVVGMAILVVLRPDFDALLPVLLMLLSGITTSLSDLFYWRGLEKEDATTANIFGQLIPVFVLVLAWVFLKQEIGARELVAFAAIFLAPVLVMAMKKRRRKRASAKAALYLTIYAVISAVAELLFVQAVDISGGWDFFVCMAVMMVGKGATDMALMAGERKWRKQFYKEAKKRKFKIFAVIGGGTLLWLVSDVLYHIAIVNAESMALASVSSSTIEMIAVFVLGVVLTLLWPKFGREDLSRRSLLSHLGATALVIVGIILIG